jgi:hypothetical protein
VRVKACFTSVDDLLLQSRVSHHSLTARAGRMWVPRSSLMLARGRVLLNLDHAAAVGFL